MSKFLILAFLFCIGNLTGWGIEVIYRKFFSAANPARRWINPGFLTGPYIPLYGFGLVILFLIASLEDKFAFIDSVVLMRILLFAVMAVCMTVIEFIAGACCLRFAHVRLWDYSDRKGNIMGIVCPLFSFYWALLGAFYYFLIHPRILNALAWLSGNLAFSFFIGLFYGVFLVDLGHNTHIIVTIRDFAVKNQIVVRYDDLKEHIREHNIAMLIRVRFWFSMHTDRSFHEILNDYYKKHQEHLTEYGRAISGKRRDRRGR